MEWNRVESTMVPNRPSYPVNALMSATSKLALVKPRLAASALASSMAVGDRSSPTVVKPLLREIQVDRRLAAAGIEHVAVELALLDQRGDLRLRPTDAPRRLGAEPQLRSLALYAFSNKSCHGVVMYPVYQSS